MLPRTRLVAAIMSASVCTSALAAITSTGEVTPTPVTSWTSTTTAYVGKTADGALTINGSSDVLCSLARLGYSDGVNGALTITGTGSTLTCSSNYTTVGDMGSGDLRILDGGSLINKDTLIASQAAASGIVTVDGANSVWSCDGAIDVGTRGHGKLIISNGATVAATGRTILGRYDSASGELQFGPGGGTLTTSALYASPSQLTGTGTINASGLVYDTDILVDSTHPKTQTLTWNAASQNITVNLDLSKTTGGGPLGAGFRGTGSLTIQDGQSVTSGIGYLGYFLGSSGTATISGPNTTWTCASLSVGYYGSGTLNISHGATVAVTLGETYIGYYPGASGCINFGPGGGTLNVTAIRVSPTQVTGTGTINAGSMLADFDLRLDKDHGRKQTVTWNGPGQNVTVNLDIPFTGVPVLGAGYTGTGTLTIRDAIQVSSWTGEIGYHSGSNGTVSLSGAGTKWYCGAVAVGRFGAGILNISNGGSLNGSGGWIGMAAGSTGGVTIDGTGSNWTIPNPSPYGDVTVGDHGQGSLRVANGGLFLSPDGLNIGHSADGSGTVAVTGAKSCLQCGKTLYVGYSGAGTLLVADGGRVYADCAVGSLSSARGANTVIVQRGGQVTGDCTIGWGGVGTVIIDGADSKWTAESFTIGAYGTATLNISNGGKFTTSGVSISAQSLLAISVNGTTALSAGGLTNSGLIRLKAAPDLTPGTYTPITATTWYYGSGTVQAIGGTWNATTNTFTVAAAQSAAPSTPVTINRQTTQRIDVVDPAGNSLTASFAPTASSSNLTFQALPFSDAQTSALALLSGDAVLSAWNFQLTNYTAGDPVYLSFDVPANLDPADLAVYHYDNATAAWTLYAPTDFCYDGSHVSFTVTSFSGYAITADLPEPGSLALLTLAALPLLARRRGR